MPTLNQPIAVSSDGVAFEGGYDPTANTNAAKELDSSATANGTTYGPQRVVVSGLSGYIAAAGGAPTATSAGVNTAWSFVKKVNHLWIQNNTTSTIQIELDTAATAGSPVLQAGVSLLFDIKATSINILAASALNINGSTANNIVIRGWL